MPQVVLGDSSVLAKETISVDPQVGATITRVYEGTSAAVLPIYVVYVNAKWKVNLETGPKWTLIVTSADPTIIEDLTGLEESPVNNYEVEQVQFERPILSIWHPLFTQLVIEDRLALKDFTENPAKYISTSPALTGDPKALEMYKMLQNGHTTFSDWYPVLRVSYNCSNQWDLSSNEANDGRILSLESLIVQEQVPLTTQSKLRQTGYFDPIVIDALGLPNLAYGYLQTPSRVSIGINTLRQVSQEFIFNLWAVNTYGELI